MVFASFDRCSMNREHFDTRRADPKMQANPLRQTPFMTSKTGCLWIQSDPKRFFAFRSLFGSLMPDSTAERNFR
ncbi:MAG: hypothetical protein MI923_28315 [Phycisphaerales bacterium]|nr:hypothetical protein [Phycisphaerales bacterium]